MLKHVGAPHTLTYLAEVAEYILAEIVALTPQELHILRKP